MTCLRELMTSAKTRRLWIRSAACLGPQPISTVGGLWSPARAEAARAACAEAARAARAEASRADATSIP